jgi:hypothetical protein
MQKRVKKSRKPATPMVISGQRRAGASVMFNCASCGCMASKDLSEEELTAFREAERNNTVLCADCAAPL